MNPNASAPPEPSAAAALLPLDPTLRDELYRELRQLARQRLRRSGPLTLQISGSASLAGNQFRGFGTGKVLYPGALILMLYPYAFIN